MKMAALPGVTVVWLEMIKNLANESRLFCFFLDTIQTLSLSQVSVLASFIRIAKKKKVAGVLCLAARTMIYTGDAVAAPNMILTKARDWYNVNISDCMRKCIYLSTQS